MDTQEMRDRWTRPHVDLLFAKQRDVHGQENPTVAPPTVNGLTTADNRPITGRTRPRRLSLWAAARSGDKVGFPVRMEGHAPG
jgi:hypothetical protein